ncbi:MAG: ankyrin repeat domain-containing protein [Spirochaetes bacterium]|nr:ankyrin repeat domain-containing protein [Spirochaetota bacterium]
MGRPGAILFFSFALLSAAPANQEQVLRDAITAGDLPGAQAAILAGADLTARDFLGRTPLILASAFAAGPMVRLIAEKNFYAMDLGDGAGQTALMMACVFGNTEAVKVLLELKVEVHKTSRYGSTALLFAKRYGREEIQALLQAADAAK